MQDFISHYRVEIPRFFSPRDEFWKLNLGALAPSNLNLLLITCITHSISPMQWFDWCLDLLIHKDFSAFQAWKPSISKSLYLCKYSSTLQFYLYYSSFGPLSERQGTIFKSCKSRRLSCMTGPSPQCLRHTSCSCTDICKLCHSFSQCRKNLT